MASTRRSCLITLAFVAVLGAVSASVGVTLTSSPNKGDELELKFKGYTEDTGVTFGNPGEKEITWGIGSVTDIFNLTQGGSPIWVGSGNRQGQPLDFVLYGIADDSQTSNPDGKYMSWVLTPSDINNRGDHTTTLVQDADANELPTSVSDKFLADCVSGHDEDLNVLSDLFGDFLGQFTLQAPTKDGFPGGPSVRGRRSSSSSGILDTPSPIERSVQ